MKIENLLIIGAGYTGLELAKQAVEAGLHVIGTTRSGKTLAALEALGALGVRWDVIEDDLDVVRSYLGPQTAVVYSVPTIFREYEAGEGGQMARHVAPVARVVDACVEAHVARFVYLSSTAVMGDHGGEWVDEDSVARPDSPFGVMRKEIEDYLLAESHRVNVAIARIVGIYGPGRTMMERVTRQGFTLVDGGERITNRIHVEDLARSVLAMIWRAPSGGQVYLVCDGKPVTVRELVAFVCQKLGVELPPEESLQDYAGRKGPNVIARWKNTLRCKNDRLVQELGVELHYPDVFSGYAALFGEAPTS